LQDPVKLYNPTSVSEFQSRNSLIDWTSLLSSILPIDINTVSTIIDRTPEYYQRLQELLSSRQVTLQTLQEYFVVLYVSEHIYSLDSTSRAAQRKMEGDISSGTSTEQPRWRQCVGYTSSTFSDSLGRYYTLKKFGSENERKKAEAFLVSIHKAWLDRLPNIEWLDDQTRAKAVEKVYSLY
jgi:predicted metalloendopeptidase